MAGLIRDSRQSFAVETPRKAKKTAGRKPAPHGERVIKKGWEPQVLDVLAMGLTLGGSVAVLKEKYGISINIYTLKSYKKNYFDINQEARKQFAKKLEEKRKQRDETRNEAVERLIKKAETAVDYYEGMVVKLEMRMLEIEKSGFFDDAAYRGYAEQILRYQGKKFELLSSVDVNDIRARIVSEFSKAAIEVFLPYVPDKERSQCINSYKAIVKEMLRSERESPQL